MLTLPIRRYAENRAIHQIKRISEHAAIVVGIRNVEGTRKHPSVEAYVDIAVQRPMGHCSRFGIKSAILGNQIPHYLLEDAQLRESIDLLVTAGLIANSDYAANMIRLTADDTLHEALKLTYAPS